MHRRAHAQRHAHARTPPRWLRNSPRSHLQPEVTAEAEPQEAAGDDGGDGQYSHTNESFASGRTQLDGERTPRQKFISPEKERSAPRAQGHTRTGDNEIRVNEG